MMDQLLRCSVVVILLLWPCIVAATGLESFRTEEVRAGFDISKAAGLWYEIAFQDVAQIGASCQTITNAVDRSTGTISQTFSTRYGVIPYNQKLTYEPDPSGERGVYTKYLDGAKALLKLPTVIVDVVDGDDGQYMLMTEFTRKTLVVTLTELRFLSRTPVVSSAQLQTMKDVASSVGIDHSVIESMKVVDHSACAQPGGLSVGSSARDDVLIVKPPAGKKGAAAAWILLPGAQIDKNAYQPLAEAVQRETSMPLWVGVLGTYLTPTAVPPEIGPRIDALLEEMKDQGLSLDTVNLFYGGHSLGSVFIQDHLKQYNGPTGPMAGMVKVLGQVLMGGFIQRKYRYPTWSYPVTTLTIGGELDGLARCTRLAEAFYASKGDPAFPVGIIPGMTHMQFASGEPPALVKARDLQPEISYDDAHAAAAKLIAPYFESLSGSTGAGEILSARLSDTELFVNPIIAAFKLEGARYFDEPEQFGGPGESKCVKGGCNGRSLWAPRAQEIISAVDGWELNISNQYVDVKSTPLTGEEFHLPKITNDSVSRTISITTYSQGYWDDAQPSWFDWKEIFDHFDTGFVATSAEEIATKLASRQCTLIQGIAEPDVPFSVDDPNFCAETNKQAYEWGQHNAGSSTTERFSRYGQKYTFGNDQPKSGGPFFIDAHLQFNEVTGAGGQTVIQVSAPMQKTEIDYWEKHFGPIPRPSYIPDPGCFHYCKLLSPARATEWIYVDSLRLRRSLSSATDTPIII